MKYTDLVALTQNGSINHIDANCKIVPRNKQESEIDHVEYISQELEIDLPKKLYRSRFGANHRGNYILNGFIIKDGWNQIGQAVVQTQWKDSRNLLGIYDITNFYHVGNMIRDAIEANTDYSNAD